MTVVVEHAEAIVNTNVKLVEEEPWHPLNLILLTLDMLRLSRQLARLNAEHSKILI